jgi:hypothetical protein
MNFTMEGDVVPGPPVNCLTLTLPDDVIAQDLEKGLVSDEPVVLVHRRGVEVIVDVECLREDDVSVVTDRLVDQLDRLQP